MRKICIFSFLLVLFPSFYVQAQTVDRGDLKLILDDCGGVISQTCLPWSPGERETLSDFLYGPGKTSADNTLTGAYQFIRSVVGLPYQSGRTVKITHDPTSPYNAYYAGYKIVIKGLDVSGVEAGDARKKILKLLAHELMHAFQGSALPQSAFAEGLGRMMEKLIESKFNLTDSTIGPDFYFTNYDQNNDLAKGPANGNIPFELTGLAGDTYSLIGAAFTKLYFEDLAIWPRFHEELYKKMAMDSNYKNSAANLAILLKDLTPYQIEGLAKEDWFSRQAAFAYNQTAGPVLSVVVDRNAFLYVHYFYRDSDGKVSQKLSDGRLINSSTISDIEVNVKYYDAYGNLIKNDSNLPSSSWAGFTDTNRIWTSLSPLNLPHATKAVIEFKIKSTGTVFTKEVWLVVQNPWNGVLGVTSATFKNNPDEGKVMVSSLGDPAKSYTLPVSKGIFYTPLAESSLLEDLEGPILVSYLDQSGQKVRARKINKIKGHLTVILDAYPVVAVSKSVVSVSESVSASTSSSSTVEDLQKQLQELINQLAALQGSSSVTEQSTSENVSGEIAVFDKNLYFGLKNDPDVRNLQELLTKQGYYSGPITGNYFLLTLEAVKKFQTANGINPTGYFGLKSREIANTILESMVAGSGYTAEGQIQIPKPASATSSPASNLPDVTVESVQIIPNPLVADSSVTILTVLKNIGGVAAITGLKRINATNETFMGQIDGISLKPGEAYTDKTSFVFPGFATCSKGGDNVIRVFADYANNVVESNENNNILDQTIKLLGCPTTSSLQTQATASVATSTIVVAPSASSTPMTQSSTPLVSPSTSSSQTTSSQLSAGNTTSSSTPTSSINLTASSMAVDDGSTVTLSWTSANVTSCSASGGWAGEKPTSGTYTTGSLYASVGSYTFSLSCTGSSGAVNSGVTVTVNQLAPIITINAPGGGEQIRTGQSYTIQWRSSSNTGVLSTVRISLYKAASYKDFIAVDVSNTGSYVWSVPTNLPAGDDYQIRIFNPAYPNNFKDSPKFTISVPVSYTNTNTLASISVSLQTIAEQIKNLTK